MLRKPLPTWERDARRLYRRIADNRTSLPVTWQYETPYTVSPQPGDPGHRIACSKFVLSWRTFQRDEPPVAGKKGCGELY